MQQINIGWKYEKYKKMCFKPIKDDINQTWNQAVEKFGSVKLGSNARVGIGESLPLSYNIKSNISIRE